VRGFPIRTSSDHGSFANSPRLIAGYNVLLRLLVPRHPPCALINLTTKIIQKRCSRPLCSSQATTGTSTLTPAPTHHTRPVPGFRAMGGSTERYQPAATRAPPPPTGSDATRSDPDETTFRLFPQDPTACPANPSPAANRSHPEPEGPDVLGRHQLESRPQSMFHPRAPSPTRSAGTTGLDTTSHPMTGRPDARCSLERR
jgi:hypothetical protein